MAAMEKKTRDLDRKTDDQKGAQPQKRAAKVTEYGRQLQEKQKVKEAYGVRENQFKRFFEIAARSREATGETLLTLLERRLDNVVYRLRLSTTRRQARQVIVHGHMLVNGVRVTSPSYLVHVGDVVHLATRSSESETFVKTVIEKRAAANVKVPEWLEHDRKAHSGRVIRFPVRADVSIQVNENFIVELYSK
jgi:small subunit ribosomal protein S4